jgi:hypothetical protein
MKLYSDTPRYQGPWSETWGIQGVVGPLFSVLGLGSGQINKTNTLSLMPTTVPSRDLLQ